MTDAITLWRYDPYNGTEPEYRLQGLPGDVEFRALPVKKWEAALAAAYDRGRADATKALDAKVNEAIALAQSAPQIYDTTMALANILRKVAETARTGVKYEDA